ncbi:MAG: hypothetical protein M3081_02890 [Gemmatimonadota bacterium]|nr:hypothetical protein [Gemmatimonadota bacterium]
MTHTADEWIDAIHREFARESDRAAGIVVAAMLDEALRLLLAKRILPPVKKERNLLDGHRAPLGTFSARIDAAQQLGLISRFFARDLHLVREIRNAYAHQVVECTFERPDIRDRVEALERASDYNARRPDLRDTMGPPGTRGDFLGITAWMLYSLHREVDTIAPLTERGPEFGYIDWALLPLELRRFLSDGTES